MKHSEQQAAEDIAILYADKVRLEHENMLLRTHLQAQTEKANSLKDGILRLTLGAERTRK